MLDIDDVRELTHLSEMRVRTAMRRGELVSHLEPVKEGSKTNHRVTTPEDVLAWRKSTEAHTKRDDGRNKYNIYMTPDEYEVVTKLFKANKVVVPIGFANKRKPTEA